MSFGVVDDEIRAAATAAGAAADQAHRLVLAEGPDQITAALPGGQASKAAERLAQDWAREIRGWTEMTGTYGQNLTRCADQYSHDDTTAADKLARIGLTDFEDDL